MRNLFFDEIDEFMQTIYKELEQEINNSFFRERGS